MAALFKGNKRKAKAYDNPKRGGACPLPFPLPCLNSHAVLLLQLHCLSGTIRKGERNVERPVDLCPPLLEVH